MTSISDGWVLPGKGLKAEKKVGSHWSRFNPVPALPVWPQETFVRGSQQVLFQLMRA